MEYFTTKLIEALSKVENIKEFFKMWTWKNYKLAIETRINSISRLWKAWSHRIQFKKF